MTGRYKCDVCGWCGNNPAIEDPHGDGGYPVCPNTSCYDEDGEFSPVFLNPLHPDVARMILKAKGARYE